VFENKRLDNKKSIVDMTHLFLWHGWRMAGPWHGQAMAVVHHDHDPQTAIVVLAMLLLTVVVLTKHWRRGN